MTLLACGGAGCNVSTIESAFHPGILETKSSLKQVALTFSPQTTFDPSWTPQYTHLKLYMNFDQTPAPISDGDPIAALVGPSGIAQTPSSGDLSYVNLGYFSSGLGLMNTVSDVDVPSLFGNPQKATLMAWINLQDYSNSNGTVISLGDYVALTVNAGGSGVRGFFYDGSQWNQTLGGSAINGTGWHHVAYVIDQTAGTQSVYMDGVPVGSSSFSGAVSYSGLGADTILGDHGDIWIGQALYKFSGIMDEVAVFDTNLSDSEIQTIYLSQNLARVMTPLNDWSSFSVIARYRFDTTAPGGELKESSGNFNDAFCNAWECPVPGPGKFGDAFYFSENEFLYLSNTQGLVGDRNEASISYWVNYTGPQMVDNGFIYQESDGGGPTFATVRGFSDDANVIIRFQGGWAGGAHSAPTPLGSWHHHVAVVSNQSLLLYVDGELASWNMVDGRVFSIVTAGLGAYTAGGFSQGGRLLGAIDDLVAFDQALTPQQVRKIYEAGQSGIAFGD